MIPASSLSCGRPPSIGIVTNPKPAFWPLFVLSTFNRSSRCFCSTVRTALNVVDEGFAPGNSDSSMFSVHVPEKSGFGCALGMSDVNATARHTRAVFVIIGRRHLDGIDVQGVYAA